MPSRFLLDGGRVDRIEAKKKPKGLAPKTVRNIHQMIGSAYNLARCLYFYKVQAKHVDFVILNEKLVARCIIELDDASHDTEERRRRDEFVDDVLKSVGYQIIHTRAVTEEVQQQIREIMKT